MADRGRAPRRGPAARRGAARAFRLVGAALLAFGLLLSPFSPGGRGSAGAPIARAAGTCASPATVESALRQADVVFVGSVMFLENDDRWATVSVEERWRGADALGDTVVIHGAGEAGTSTPDDRAYEPGQRYLFAVGTGEAFLVDNACTATTPWTDSLAKVRPDGVQPYPGLAVSSPIEDVDMAVFLPMTALIVALVVVVVAYLIVLRSRRRPPDWMR